MRLRGLSKSQNSFLLSPLRCSARIRSLSCIFSLFINNLPVSLRSSVSCSLYADDLAIWSSFPSVPTAVEPTQAALIRLERLLEYWCLCLNPSKCEASSFSVNLLQANLQPNLLLLNFRLRFNPTSTYLGSPSIALFPFLNMFLR